MIKVPAGETTTVKSVDTTTPGKATIRSETVAAALFGIGAVLLLCAAFFSRIAKISLPGGAGLELLPLGDQAKVVKHTAAEAAARGISDPDTLARAFVDASTQLIGGTPRPSPAAMSGSAPDGGRDALIAQAARTALDRVAPPDRPRR